MEGINADLTVEGSTANRIAGSLLGALDIDPPDISDADVGVRLSSPGGSTLVTVQAEGPQAGKMLAAMFGGVEWDEHTVPELRVELSGDDGNGDDDESGGGDVAEADGGADAGAGGAFVPRVSLPADRIDPSHVHFPGVEPRRVSAGTQTQGVAGLLVRHWEVRDGGDPWISAAELAEFAGEDDVTVKQIRSVLSHLFHNSGLIVRRKVMGPENWHYEYIPSQQLVDEVQRLGGAEESVAVLNER